MKISLYFVFYLAMILELLVFIVDRDEAEEQLQKINVDMAYALADEYSRLLVLRAPDIIYVPKNKPANQVIAVLGLHTKSECASIRYETVEGEPGKITTDPTSGNGVITGLFSRPTVLKVRCRVHREIPSYIPSPTDSVIIGMLETQERLGPHREVVSDPITIKVVPSGQAGTNAPWNPTVPDDL
jgi:hypothetical protein